MNRVPIPSDPPPSVSAETVLADHWQIRVQTKLRSHDHLGAYDAAIRALSGSPDDIGLKHKALSALAGAGDAERACNLLNELNGSTSELSGDTIALGAKLAEQHAMSLRGDQRAAHARTAARLYESIYSRTKGTYSGIRAATMFLFAGDAAHAERLALEVLSAGERERPVSPEEAYYVAAIEAQAALLSGDVRRAQKKVRALKLLSGSDPTQCGAFRKHLLPICEAKHLPADILSVLRPPPVIMYSGASPPRPGFQSPPSFEQEIQITGAVANYLRLTGAGTGYGSLACGPDILIAEQLLTAGAKLCAVLPAPAPIFRKYAAEPGGPAWTRRFDACLSAASRVICTATIADVPSPDLYLHSEKTAMGLALLHADALDAAAERLAVEPAGENDIELESNLIKYTPRSGAFWWSKRGFPTVRIDPGAWGSGEDIVPARFERDEERAVRAVLFGEFTGMDRMAETQIPIFTRSVIGRIGHLLDECGTDVLLRGAWAEHFGVAFSSVEKAARAALALQQCMAGFEISSRGFSGQLGLRLCAHLAPVYQGAHPISRQPSFFGSHFDRMAKLDMLLPEGQLYATETFAATLMLETSAFQCEAVGRTAPTPSVEAIRMFVVKPKP